MVPADVVIVGGGPAGASTAWALARNGVDVLVVDTAHGHSAGVLERVRWVRRQWPFLRDRRPDAYPA